MSQAVSANVAAFVTLLGVALLISIAAERFRIPAAVLLVAVGALASTVGHLDPPFAFGPAVLFVFLPPLVYEAAWNLDLRALRANAPRIALLAIVGTLVTAFAVGGALAASGVMPLAAALLFGAIVAATDPVAVVAVFRNVAVPVRIRTIVEAESLANDGVAVVLYGTLLALAHGASVSFAGAVGSGAYAIACGTLVGIGCALPMWAVLRGARSSESEVTATIALAYVAYLVADRIGASGIFATAASAVALRTLLARIPHMDNRADVDAFWNAAAFIANATVFLATGLAIDVGRAAHEPSLVVVAIAALAASRLAIAFVAANDRAGRTTVFLAGMRGALPLALALAVPADVPGRPLIVDGAFAVVLITLVVQGVALRPVVRRLYGAMPASANAPVAANASADASSVVAE
ncbi:MAG: Na+/H+ antiporter [Vulcanimicrobiaceae bacterium]